MCKAKGSYYKMFAGVVITGIVLNILCGGEGYTIMAPLATGLVISLNGMGKKLGAAVAGAVFIGACTSHAFIYNPSGWGLIMNMAADYVPSSAITPVSMFLDCWPTIIIMAIISVIIAKWYKPKEDIGDLSYFEVQLQKMGKITRKEKANIFMLAILLGYILTEDIHHLDTSLGFALIPWTVYLPFINGADSDTIKCVNVSMVLFMGSCMAIGTTAASLGVGSIIVQVFNNILAGNTSPFLMMTIVFVIVFIFNFLMTPMAIFSLVTQPLCMLAATAGLSAIPFLYSIAGCAESIIFPYEFASYLYIYSFGMITMKDFIKINMVRTIIFFIGFLTILVPYWLFIGLF